MYLDSEYDNSRISKNRYIFSYFIILIALPLTLPLGVLLIIVKIIPILSFQKKINIENLYSLVVIFPEHRAVNIQYGLLSKQEIEFLESYFKDYFEIKTLKKTLLYVPRVKGE